MFNMSVTSCLHSSHATGTFFNANLRAALRRREGRRFSIPSCPLLWLTGIYRITGCRLRDVASGGIAKATAAKLYRPLDVYPPGRLSPTPSPPPLPAPCSLILSPPANNDRQKESGNKATGVHPRKSWFRIKTPCGLANFQLFWPFR